MNIDKSFAHILATFTILIFAIVAMAVKMPGLFILGFPASVLTMHICQRVHDGR